MIHVKSITVIVVISILILSSSLVFSAPNEYLKYQEPQPATSSAFSTIAYVISLIITFVVVIGLAYFTSKFLGQKVGRLSSAGDNRILLTFPLGTNKAVYVVEIAGRFLILGVTEHNISLLQEITAKDEIEKLKQLTPASPTTNSFDQIFDSHLASLQNMSRKFPAVFRNSGAEDKREGNR